VIRGARNWHPPRFALCEGQALARRGRFFSGAEQSLSSAEAIAERDAIPGRIAGAEFDVVVNQVEPYFWTNEGVAPKVSANATPDVSHEVIAANVIGTAGDETTTHRRGIEPKILAANTRHQLRGDGFGQLRSPDCIEGVENRTIGLEASVQILTCPPVDLALDSDTVREQEIRTEAGVRSASHGGEEKAIRGFARARLERAKAKGEIDLLSVRDWFEKAEYKEDGNQA